jgi:hypothetical protein
MLNVTRPILLLILLTSCLCCSSSSTARISGPSSSATSCGNITVSPIVLNAGDTLRMNFTVPTTNGTDVLLVDVTFFSNTVVPGPSVSCQLFNGDQLLATTRCGNLQSSATLVPLPDVPTIDFSPISAGLFAGRMEFSVTGGSWLFDLAGARVGVGRARSTFAGQDVIGVADGTIVSFTLLSSSCR